MFVKVYGDLNRTGVFFANQNFVERKLKRHGGEPSELVEKFEGKP